MSMNWEGHATNKNLLHKLLSFYSYYIHPENINLLKNVARIKLIFITLGSPRTEGLRFDVAYKLAPNKFIKQIT